MHTRTCTPPVVAVIVALLFAAVGCGASDDAQMDASAAPDTLRADAASRDSAAGGDADAQPPADGTTSGRVDKVQVIGVRLDPDYASNGKVTFTVLPSAADGTALIDSTFAYDVTTSAAGVTAVVSDKTELRPPAGEALHTGLLFDSSGSMGSNDPTRLRVDAGKQFIDQLDGNDPVAVADFGSGATAPLQATRLLQDFTTDHVAAKSAVSLVKSSGGTPMFESVTEVLVAFNLRFPAAQHPHRALVVLGDGEPNGSGTLLAACTAAKLAKIPINTIGFGPAALTSPKVDLEAVWNLGALAACSGGTYSSVAKAQDLARTYTAIGQLHKRGRMEITVTYSPVPKKQLVAGSLSVGDGTQTPVTVSTLFYAP